MADEDGKATTVSVTDAKAAGRKRLARMLGLVFAVIVIVAALGGAVYGLVKNPTVTETVRDLSIIALAVTTLVIGVFLAVVIFQLQSLIALLRDEVRPILESASQTVSTVRGTTAFLSDTVVSPVITVASYASALRQTVRVLAGRGRRSTGKPGPSRDQGTEEEAPPSSIA